MPDLIGLDFETYSDVDLKKHGLYRYTESPFFRPLLVGLATPAASSWYFDISQHSKQLAREYIGDAIHDSTIVAHNVPFERRVLAWLDLHYPAKRFIDSAVVARAVGAASKLEAAAPQLLGVDKMDEGTKLIRMFSVPGKHQEANGNNAFDSEITTLNRREWDQFGQYCALDAKLGLNIVLQYISWLTPAEQDYSAITLRMNETGWCVDVPLVEEMQRRYLENQEVALQEFRFRYAEPDLNLNSLKQMKEWCAARGVKANSFSKERVEKLIAALDKKFEDKTITAQQWDNYKAVWDLLHTKQILGGSSLKKLKVILNIATLDSEEPETHRLRDQYVHIGAGQTWRTTGRSVQMQNLKRLRAEVDDMDELVDDPESEWDNSKLADNLRQVFTATDPNGRLLVGDFSSVESRGLAYLAGEQWKLAAYRKGQDLYIALASQMFGVPYGSIGKRDPRRQTGKVGELSCGYGAAEGAIVAFAAGMGVELTEAEGVDIKQNWRAANPTIVQFWWKLDEMLKRVVELGSTETHGLPDGLRLRFQRVPTPDSLTKLHKDARSVEMQVVDRYGTAVMRRYFHGCYMRGKNVGYYKPSELKSGNLWRNHYKDPKTKQVRFYELYGGKLAGILTQSFCRELFMQSLAQVHTWTTQHGQVQLVGQFHDEIVVDWKPGASVSLDDAMRQMRRCMSDPGIAASFPLAAEIKSDYRYTK